MPLTQTQKDWDSFRLREEIEYQEMMADSFHCEGNALRDLWRSLAADNRRTLQKLTGR